VRLTALDEIERTFLAQCIALGAAGRAELARMDPEQHFTSPLARRALQHLLEHGADPAPERADDEELAALLTELAVRASRDPATPASLDAQRLQLELRRLDRRLAAVRAAGGDGATDLAARRARVKAEFDQAIERATSGHGV
jgi:hypothetical protein